MRERGVIVTGGSGGQGRATARLLARAGHRVTVFDRAPEAAGRHPGDEGIRYYELDVADFPAVERAVREVAGDQPGVDTLLACAGVHDRAALAEGDPRRWTDVMMTNVVGVATCIRACLPLLLKRDRADVVIWGSVSGLVPYANESIYAASKAAVTHLADCLRHEVAPDGVRVTVIHPGLVDTEMTRANPAAMAMLEGMEPALPEDIARCVQFILDQPPHLCVSELILRCTKQTM